MDRNTEDSRRPPTGNANRARNKRWIAAIAGLLLLCAITLLIFFRRGSSSQEGRPVPAPVEGAVPAPSEARRRAGDITITLSPEEIQSAQIKTEVATEQSGAEPPGPGPMRTTGTVQSNAYKEVPVLPISGGIIRAVNAQLGDKVRRGQPLAAIFSTELADAQGAYLKVLAQSEQHHQEYQRTIKLVEIGAMSREDLEKATADYKIEQANVASARQRLILLGMGAKQVDGLTAASQVESVISIPAPSSGTIISRTVNPGEVTATGKELFRIADLSSVWVIGQVYEADFARVRLGTPAVVTTPAYPARTFTGRVSYVDPRVDAQTRTAQVRIEVPNPGEVLKIGMFVDVSFDGVAPTGTAAQRAVLVPSSAVQTIGTKKVVFVATGQPGVFVQREVTIGPEANGQVPVYGGIAVGEQVATEGSFLLRAESLKLNPAQTQQ
jgi:RND family efflux transporter MFP subunit